MEKFYQIPIAFLLVGLCVVLVYTWAVGTSSNYGYGESLINDGKNNFSKLEESLNDANEDALIWQEKFRSDNLLERATAIVLFSIFGIVDLVWSSVTGLWNVLSEIIFTTFGFSAIILSTLTSILIIWLIFKAWEAIKQ